MAREIPTTIPAQHSAGDTLDFKRYYADFLPADGWTLTVYLINADNRYSFTGSDNGDGYHLVDVSGTTTGEWLQGTYMLRGFVSDGTDRYQVEEQIIEVLPDLSKHVSGFDARSHVKKVLDALEATIEGKASKDQSSYSIAGRSISRMSPEELLTWRDKYKREYQSELSAQKLAKGMDSGNLIKVRF